MNEQQHAGPQPQPQQHYDDPNRPGWCAVCRCAFPCPATATRADLRRIAIQFRHAR